jgi:hypothetical protein
MAAQNFLSVAGQAVGSPGYCVLSWADPQGRLDASISFLPTLVTITQHQFAPLQKVNMSINGTIHIFQYGTQELLTWDMQCHDLPYDQTTASRLGHSTDAFIDLLSFVRTTLNYSQEMLTVQHPDGMVEQMRYTGGIADFQEAQGQAQRAQFWTGHLTFQRVIP